jgi:Ca2+:H+ antiporter
VIPAAYHATKHIITPNRGFVAAMSDELGTDLDEKGQRGLLIISRGTAILLLGVYIAYLIFQLKTHASLFVPKRRRTLRGDETGEDVTITEDVETPRMSVVAAGVG